MYIAIGSVILGVILLLGLVISDWRKINKNHSEKDGRK